MVKRCRVLADSVSESVKPGFYLFGTLTGKSALTRGMGGSARLILYQSGETLLNGALLTTVEKHKAIEGKEHQWLRDVAPSYFPEV